MLYKCLCISLPCFLGGRDAWKNITRLELSLWPSHSVTGLWIRLWKHPCSASPPIPINIRRLPCFTGCRMSSKHEKDGWRRHLGWIPLDNRTYNCFCKCNLRMQNVSSSQETKKKRKIAVLPVKAVLVAKKNLLPYLYCVTLRRGSCLELQCKM